MPHPTKPTAVNIIGCRVDRVSQEMALQQIELFCEEPAPHLVVTADSSMLVMAQDDTGLKRILESADLVVPDSIGVVWASHLLGDSIEERVTGVDLADRLCEICARHGWSVYLLGSAPGVADRAADRLLDRYPGLRIAGVHHGFFSAADEGAILQNIRDTAPTVLFAAMGIPRQERWLAKHLPSLPCRVGMGIGGSLDVFAGEVKRAPGIFRKTNTEWLYRVLSDPRRIKKTRLLPLFACLVLRQRFFSGRA